ncbi:heat shock protein transcriptional repressor HspR [Nocardioides yefusunii]|uniref:Heat shock protein transcriptional repressor HspR n=1 Tax=Nocardioides yefusunii TaxID=2500546 RepID=A0ABW1QU42_9ACTN|nr:MerR family transcriptional regulator [Nocardioides yefusunii]
MTDFGVPSPDAAVYVISVAAELTGLHPQTLRTYERQGLITPGRTGGGGRRYSARDVEKLREIAELTATGIGLEGVKRILELDNQVTALQAVNDELRAELAATREALRQALAATSAAQNAAAKAARPVSRVPALRPAPSTESAVVVWRRGGQR